MTKTFSVAEARQHFARVLQTAARGRVVEITRRGRPVAVVLSATRYLALAGKGPRFAAAIDAVRVRHAVGELAIGDADFLGLRDPVPGREVSL